MRISGRQIDLRTMEKSDLANKVRWYNDPEVNKTLLLEEKFELDRSLKWFETAKDDKSRRDFVIETPEAKAIGITGFLHINKVHETAECYCVIGDKTYWGRGIGTEVHTLLIDWGFKELGLYKIWADIRAQNAAIIKVVERLGFKVEGTLRKDRVIGGERIDVVRIGLLRDEFYELHPELKEKSQSGT